MRYVVEQWAPDYGASAEGADLAETEATVDVGIELPAEEWRPLHPADGAVAPTELAFVDGVRRVEARVWVDDGDGPSRMGLCASYAAGVVRCNGAATVVDAQVQRCLFAAGASLAPIETRHGRFGVRQVASDTPDALSLALQSAMTELEHHVSTGVPDDCLLVVDGPLRERRLMEHAVGFVKRQHVGYLPAVVGDIVGTLSAGQRTPVFLIGEPFPRWSWYLCLPGERSHTWASVVRCEVGPDRSVEEVRGLADACTLTLPRFASEAHKDSRAPQNLYPIAGLERELRRRLGDPKLLYRALRVAA